MQTIHYGVDGVNDSDNDNTYQFNPDNDDIYIMVKCMSVCMSVTFLLISFSPISGHFWV